ncbi:DUF537-domain-containing protein [Obba rivulosa]|uniref:DUF537-domain-containing protein n=1 Tax=Obba rivulosa TaxID=1052685 RepID=A0A8E2DT40_9APHY|nr:DUF537-domain-containing protein [Obba rivulosa]
MSNAAEPVAVFWDYENCSPPYSGEGCSIVSNIREIAHEFGSLKQFKAYLQLSEQSPKSVTLRSDLQSSGVSLTDCPHSGRKDVVDKMMIVDMLTFAMDTPAPATIILISGDRDFVYAVSVLRMRRYRVVLIAPNSTHCGLKSQASIILNWEFHVLRIPKAMNSSNQVPGLDPSEYVDIASEPRHRRTRSSTTSMSSMSSAPLTTPRTPCRPSIQDIKKGIMELDSTTSIQVDIMTEEEYSLDKISGSRSRIPAPLGGKYIQDTDTSAISFSDDGEPVQGAEVLQAIKQRSPPSDSSSNSQTSSLHVTNVDLETEAARRCWHIGAASAPEFIPLSSRFASVTSAHQTNSLNWSSIARSQVHGPPTLDPAAQASSPVNSPQAFMGGTLSTLAESGATLDTAFTSKGAVPAPGQKETCSDTLNKPELRPVSAPAAASSPQPAPLATMSAPEASLPPIPPQFSVLINLLLNYRAKGIQRPLRGPVAVALAGLCKNLYVQAGVRRFKEYSLLAESAGIVELGGLEGQAWISLTPMWCDRVAVGS